jgi:hypothetical protein
MPLAERFATGLVSDVVDQDLAHSLFDWHGL